MGKPVVRFEPAAALASLQADPSNPRKIDALAQARLRKALDTFGMVEPLIVREETGTIIGGHQRKALLESLGHAVAPAFFLKGLTDHEAAALNILLNNENAQGAWDIPKLAEMLSELDAHGYDATLTGFDQSELQALLASVDNPPAGLTGGVGAFQFQVIVECADEQTQATLCGELEARGLQCRLLTL